MPVYEFKSPEGTSYYGEGASPEEGFSKRLELLGSPQAEIEDRRSENDPYAHMLATNRMINKATGGLTLGFDQKLPRVTPSQLTKDIGLEDLQRSRK